MEGLTRLVADSLARHGFDRPVDFRRLQWSRWFHCDSQHSLLYVPSKPGVFALAEEVMDFASTAGDVAGNAHGETATNARTTVEERRFSAALGASKDAALAAVEPGHKRMLAVTQFFEADDMAFTLDRMLSRPNPMRARLESGRYFIRFVVIEDPLQRRTVVSALNQWIVSAAEKATGLGAHFATSLELTEQTSVGQMSVGRVPSPANAGSVTKSAAAPHLNSGAATNIHNPPVFPSGF
ncbi:MAG TPA: hypothetical protein VE866_04950 [Candidatus Binatia bacterium]|nr:hypothetical protein [Candidatus Binatia bacterium]